MTDSKKYLQVAIQAAKNAGPVFKKHFGKAKDIQMKNGDFRDLVTRADKEIETQIRKSILKNFPKHKIIGEEFSKDAVGKTDLVWIIDPIDGTTNFIQGLPICCISIGIWQNNTPLVGVVYSPIMDYLFTAVRGQGAFLNGKKIKVSEKPSLKLAFGGFGWGRNIQKAQVNFPQLVKLLHKIRTLGSATFEMCLCAMGVFDFHIQSEINIWDFAAAALLIKEAGGKITEPDGKNIKLGSKSVVSSNGKIHRQLIGELNKSLQI